VFAILLPALILAGCASPDDPTPRRPIIPQTIRDLAARQQGDAIVLSFTLPSRSTRQEPLADPPAIEIYRGEMEPGRTAPERTRTRLIYTIPGALANSYQEDGRIVFRDMLEPGAGAGRVYVVRTRAERNRASAESNRVVMRTYASPEPVTDVRALVSLAERAVMLTWSPAGQATGGVDSPAAGEYRVYRAEVAPENAAAARENPSQANLLAPLRLLGQTAEAAYRDNSFEWGRTYLYVVRRVAQLGSDTVESNDSNRAVVTPVEVSPPAAPQGVDAVVVPATSQTPAYVSLSWAISEEADVAGYAVYRSEQAETPGARLNENLLGAPTFRDVSIGPGRRYFYRVAAVNGAGQESALSAAVEVQIPEQQP
jgi:hypothetical protein